jgi:hypothetical protein
LLRTRLRAMSEPNSPTERSNGKKILIACVLAASTLLTYLGLASAVGVISIGSASSRLTAVLYGAYAFIAVLASVAYVIVRRSGVDRLDALTLAAGIAGVLQLPIALYVIRGTAF